MKKVLVIDDDDALRGMIRRRLSQTYRVFDTGDPELALAFALEHKPDAILLDLKMPKFDGFELCRNLRSLTYTCNLPIFVITGESGDFQKEFENIGITGYFEKPIDFVRLKRVLAAHLERAETKRHEMVPLKMRVGIKLEGTDVQGQQFTETISTDSVSVDGFQFTCFRNLQEGCPLDVFLTAGMNHRVGSARIVERSIVGQDLWSYRAAFDETSEWILQRA